MPSWFVRYPPRVGVVSSTVRKALSQMNGDVPQYGPMQLETKPFSAQMGGHIPTAGPVVAQLAKATAAFTKQYTDGNFSASLKKSVAALSGIVPNNATVQATTKQALMSANAVKSYEGQLAAASKKLEGAAFSGFQLQTGTLPASVKKLGMSAAGSHSAAAGGLAATVKAALFAGIGSGPVEVQINSTGSGGIIDTTGNTRTVNFGHVVTAGSSQRMYVGAASGHYAWINPSMTVSATVGGNPVTGFTQVSRVDFGNVAGWPQAHIVVWELIAPVAGTYSITVTASSNQGIDRLVANSRVYSNTSGYSNLTTQTDNPSNNLKISLTPDAGDMVFLCSAFNDGGLSATYNPSATPWYSGAGVGARTGDLDTWDFRNILGSGAAVNYSANNASRLGAIGFIIERA